MEDPIWVEQKFRSSTESLMSVWCSVVAFGQGRPSIKALFSHEAQWMTLCQSFSFALSKSQSHELCNNMEWYELVLFSQLLVEGLECSIKKSTRNASICMYQPLMIVMKQPFCSVPSSQSCIPPPPVFTSVSLSWKLFLHTFLFLSLITGKRNLSSTKELGVRQTVSVWKISLWYYPICNFSNEYKYENRSNHMSFKNP